MAECYLLVQGMRKVESEMAKREKRTALKLRTERTLFILLQPMANYNCMSSKKYQVKKLYAHERGKVLW